MTGILTITESDRVEDVSLTITESEKAVFEIEFENGEETTAALERNEAEGLVDMIEDCYRKHDGNEVNPDHE